MMKYIAIITLMMLSSVHVFGLAVEQTMDTKEQQTILDSQVDKLFGEWLFEGGFSQSTFSGVNPAYRISQGDTLLLQLWGGIDYQNEAKVDPQGNIFIPKVGPIKVQGVSNKDLNHVVLKAVKRVYKSNVEAYVTLLSSQKVKVFLSGMVEKPGLYEGQSADSLLKFIDQAGGIRRDIGSLRDISLKRNNKLIHKLDLYNFIEKGELPAIQLQDGDVIFIAPKKGEISIEGDVGFSGKYEINANTVDLSHVLTAMVPNEQATHVTIVESVIDKQGNGKKNVDAKQYPLSEIKGIKVKAGALVKVSSQLRASSISVEVTGEHDSAYEMVLPWGASLKDLLTQVVYTRLSNDTAVQLFRKSVAIRQKDMLMASLGALEQSVLTARSATNEGAQLRKAEAEIIIQWIEKAKQVQPKGQVLLADGYDASKIILQQGDKVVIPSKRNLIMVHGEVLFPTAIAYNKKLSVQDFIDHAGGSTADVDDMNILVMSPNGTFKNMNDDLKDEDEIYPGDEIFVLAKPDVKSLQITKDIMQVIYQVAVSAAVVLTL
ncbi:polysaccharide biosynthesis/export family protein [Oceaniserpentilla sp. 4NH20-0058]|uniref:polysaccharide biosynthesis/export family protein n=1 Tax=Oceaniserpentilla sp. 4NH20-0058 TaxID=3127660 RepID=UPI00310AEE91